MRFIPGYGLDASRQISSNNNNYNNNNYAPQKEEKKNLTSIDLVNFVSGAVKKVWASGTYSVDREKFIPTGTHVYYTPNFSITGKNKKELQEEVQTMQLIDRKVREMGGNTSNLAVEVKELSKERGINKNYTVKVERAEGDFEKKIRNPKTTLTERIKLGFNFVSGMRNLHLAGFAYGDMKPENNLIYEKNGETILKIGDFGKTKAVNENNPLAYKGNTRFAPPEGVLSQKGDVYSSALVLIRNFEEEFLKGVDNKKSSLLNISDENFETQAIDKLRGVERYVVEHKAFLASNPGTTLLGLKHRLELGKLPKQQMLAQQEAIHEYIDALKGTLADHPETRDKAEAFGDLLKDMTKIEGRISMEEAQQRYQEIFAL